MASCNEVYRPNEAIKTAGEKDDAVFLWTDDITLRRGLKPTSDKAQSPTVSRQISEEVLQQIDLRCPERRVGNGDF